MAKVRSFLPSIDALQKRLWHFEDASFKERCPALFEFLATAIIDGQERRGGSISLFAMNGALKCCFLDKHTQLCFYASLTGSKSLWEELEQCLVGEHEEWKPVKTKIPF